MNAELCLARMERLLEDYLADASTLERSRKPTELFGLKLGPSDDPRHQRFADDLAALLESFAEGNPDSASLRAVLEKLYAVPKRYPEPKSAFWMLIAVQGLTKKLIPGLTREDASALAGSYEAAYPRRTRLPVQDEILKALRKAAKG